MAIYYAMPLLQIGDSSSCGAAARGVRFPACSRTRSSGATGETGDAHLLCTDRKTAGQLIYGARVDDVRASKLLSLVLRHDPGRIGIELDGNGWVAVPTLLSALDAHGTALTRERLASIVAASDKKRFALDEAADRIRANQGHSVEVDLGLAASTPPGRLYHGTPRRNLDSILRSGLERRGRHAVHLSADVETARRVGSRRGAHVVLAVDAAAMHTEGHAFSVSDNGVWLVEAVPAHRLTVLGP